MDPATLVALIIVVALVVYTLSAGADFGGGIWDLFARGPRKSAQRNLIANAIGPIWEANHVWLILVVVLLFVAFPPAFAAIMTALNIPLTIMLLGVVLRGSAFAFRSHLHKDGRDYDDRTQRRLGLMFAVGSIIAPVMLGITLGAVASDRITLDDEMRVTHEFITPWLAAFPIATGLFVLAIFALLAAVYLAREAQSQGLKEIAEDFRRRAVIASVVVFVLAWVTLGAASTDAPTLFAKLTQSEWAIPLHLATGACGVIAFASLWVRKLVIARLATMGNVAIVVVGWALAQHPYMIMPSLHIDDAAAPDSILEPALIGLAAGAPLLIPSMWYLYRVFKGRHDEPTEEPTTP